MINKFEMRELPTLEAVQWNGDNDEEVNAFLNERGYVNGRYVEVGVRGEDGLPKLAVVSVGNYVVKHPNGDYAPMTASDLFDKYQLA